MNDAAGHTVIEVSGLSKRFGTLQAVSHLSLQVHAGEIFGLVGPDGAGKTTTLRMLAGVMPIDAGRIVIDGVDVVQQPERAKRHISYMPQRFGLYEDLTVDENIRFYADLFEMQPALWRERAQATLQAAELLPFRRRLAGQLSGGMKQKLGLVCALVHAPRVLLLDEPTTGVDPLSRREFWQILYGLRDQGVAMLISTAYLDEAERCDRLALLHAGAVMHCDTPAALKARMPGAMLEIQTPDARAALDRARSLPGVLGLMRVGVGLHVHVDRATRLQEIADALAAAGIGVASITRVQPSVEDLFVGLLEQTGSQEPA